LHGIRFLDYHTMSKCAISKGLDFCNITQCQNVILQRSL